MLGLFDRPRPLDVGAAVMRNVRAFFAAAYGARDGGTDFEVAVDDPRSDARAWRAW